MNFNIKTSGKLGALAIAVALAFGSIGASAQTSLDIRQDRLQLQADKAALKRQLKQLDADEKALKANTASGKMSAQSKDAIEVYRAKQAVEGARENLADNASAAAQMKADRAGMQRQLRRLDIAEARMKADKASGKMAAESKASTAASKDMQAVKGSMKAVAEGTPGSLQMKADVEALQRALARLAADQKTLKEDRTAGRMSAESKDSYQIYLAKQAIKGGKENLEDDEAAVLQMNADTSTLQRQLKRLELAEARLAANKAAGKPSATSKDAKAVRNTQQGIDATKKQITADQAELKVSQQKK